MRRKGKKHGIRSKKTIKNYQFGFTHSKYYEEIEKKVADKSEEEIEGIRVDEEREKCRSRCRYRKATKNNNRNDIANEEYIKNPKDKELRRKKEVKEEIFITYPYTKILKSKWDRHRKICEVAEYIEILATQKGNEDNKQNMGKTAYPNSFPDLTNVKKGKNFPLKEGSCLYYDSYKIKKGRNYSPGPWNAKWVPVKGRIKLKQMEWKEIMYKSQYNSNAYLSS